MRIQSKNKTLWISERDTKFVFLIILRFFVQNLLCLEQVEWENWNYLYLMYFLISMHNKICIFILFFKFNLTQTIVSYINVFICFASLVLKVDHSVAIICIHNKGHWCLNKLFWLCFAFTYFLLLLRLCKIV